MSTVDSFESILSAWRVVGEPPPATHWRDPIGALTSVACRAEFADRGGQVVNRPEDRHLVEWRALVEALQAAGDGFCAVELGAGYAPWLVRAGVAWRGRRGEAPLHLVGVEGEPTHVELMRGHALDNGLADCFVVRWGAVGAADGTTVFEVAPNPTMDWGTRPRDAPEAPAGMPRVVEPGHVEVPCWSLATLLRDLPTVDLLHVDIQGSEVLVLAAAERELGERVRRIFIGTHGRDIEGELFVRLRALGFELREERPCRYTINNGEPSLIEDGSQYWARLGA